MKRFKLLGIAVMALFALTGILAATASAEELPNVLPAGTASAPLNANTSSGEAEFGNGLLHLTSPNSTGIQIGNSTKLGYFKTTFEKVKDTTGRSCTGLGDTTTGQIVAEGTFHTRDFKENGTLLTGSAILNKELHFECGTLLIITRGCLMGALTPENVLTKTLTLTFAKSSSNEGANLITTILNEGNTAEEGCELESKTDEGAFAQSVQRQTVKITAFKLGLGEEKTVLVMRL